MVNREFTYEILNAVLSLVTEWGENYGKPIGERLLRSYPDLTPADIEELVHRSRDAEYFIYSLGERELEGEITESDIVPKAREKFSWLDASNADRLKNIAMFYARK